MYKLHYFPFRGRGEQIRLLLSAFEVEFENVFIGREQFGALKKEGPGTLMFGSLPMLEDGDFKLVQGPVIMAYLGRKHGGAPADPRDAARAEAITLGAEDMRSQFYRSGDNDPEIKASKRAEFVAGDWTKRWLPAFEGLLVAGDGEYFVGGRLSHADVAVWEALDQIMNGIEAATLEGFERLQAFYDAFARRSAVAHYLETRK